MTMMKRETNSIWNRVREDRDVDDLLFAGETNERQMTQPCSDRRESCPARILNRNISTAAVSFPTVCGIFLSKISD